jgi:SAM-dependent methyltransferase
MKHALVCPGHPEAPLHATEHGLLCSDPACPHAQETNAFRAVDGVPVVISDIMCDTLCDPARLQTYVPRASSTLDRVKKTLVGESSVTKANCDRFVALLKADADRPRILIIGSGERGRGTGALWDADDIDRVGVDIYKSDSVDVVCDAHYLPFAAGSFDGVWIQAVLEHVVEPAVVATEIHRVLKPEGIVYAETPFMQQVHEGPYDFTRFTVTGHRYLFRDFSLIDMNGNGGAEAALAWSLKYFFWAVFRNAMLAKCLGIVAKVLLRPLGLLVSKASLYDSPSGTFFLGRKSDSRIRHKDLPDLYRGLM